MRSLAAKIKTTETVQALIARDDLTESQAVEQVLEFYNRLISGELDDPEEAMLYEFGLEPDYVVELLFLI